MGAGFYALALAWSPKIDVGLRVSLGIAFALFVLFTFNNHYKSRRSAREAWKEQDVNNLSFAMLKASRIRLGKENAGLVETLKEARQLVRNVMEEGGSLIGPYRLKHADLKIDRSRKLGEGSFGTVFLGFYKGTQVAVKTVRTTRVTESCLREFRGEILLMAP